MTISDFGITDYFNTKNPPLSFSAMSAIRATCPSATAWGVPALSCTISNPNAQSVTRNIKIMWAAYSRTYGKWAGPNGLQDTRYDVICDPITQCILNPFPLTLAPNESVQFSYQGYRAGGDICAPLLAMHCDYYFWLEDETGNKSSEGVISIP